MSSFTSDLIVIPKKDGRRWKLYKEFTYHVGSKYSQEFIRVPAEFDTDFASVPSFLWWFIPYWGKYGKAAVLHDFCYQTGLYSRKRSDEIFYEAMLVGGTKRWKARLMWLGVRIFGGLSYKRS